MPLFRDGPSKEIIKVRIDHKGEALIDRIGVLAGRDPRELALSLSSCAQRTGQNEMAVTCKLREDAST